MGRTQSRLAEAREAREERRTPTAETRATGRPERAVIRHLSGSRAGVVQVLNRESILLGREITNDVQFDPFEDATVSAHHAEIRAEDGEFVLYDMGSLNGTHLNGQQVGRAVIAPGDLIGLGRSGPRLRFELQRRTETDARQDADVTPQHSRPLTPFLAASGPAVVGGHATKAESFPIVPLDSGNRERNLLVTLALMIALNIALQIFHLVTR